MTFDLLEQSLPHIKSHIYPQAIPLTNWKIRESDLPDGQAPSLDDTRWPDFQVPFFWGGYDRTAWFRRELVIPPEFHEKPLVLRLELPEALLFVNGKAFQGIDKNHTDVLLTEKAKAGQKFQLAIQAYSGRTKEVSHFNRADLAVLYRPAMEYYAGLSMLREMDKLIAPATAESKEVREVLRKALIFVKYFKPDGEEYPNAIARGLRFLREAIETDLRSTIPSTIHLVAQSHLDIVWLWNHQEGRRKSGRTFSTALRLLDEFPASLFSQSQAQLYEYVREDYPHLLEQIKQRVAEGRWEVLGSMWVEPDCNLPSGESLVRQILFGRRYFAQQLSADSLVAWLPDTFGFNAALPQILRKSGFKYFSTSKLTWNDTNAFPYNTFRWKGIDGSTIFTHFPSQDLEATLSFKDLSKTWERFQQKEQAPDLLHTFGYGDGGGGPTRDQIVRTTLLKSVPTLPPARTATTLSFFQQAEAQSVEVPEVEGELYLEKHRGTYTTHAWVKRENRLAEGRLYNAELLSCLSYLSGRSATAKKYPVDPLASAWRLVLKNQFHDILPGSAIADAYDQARTDYRDAADLASTAIDKAMRSLTKRKSHPRGGYVFSVFNTLPWSRIDYVEVTFPSTAKAFRITNNAGDQIAYQLLERSRGRVRLLLYLERVPAMGGRTITILPAEEPPESSEPWKVTSRVVETPLFRVRLDRSGRISSLYDKRLRRDLVAKGARANVLQTFMDKPKEWETWDVDEECFGRKTEILRAKASRILQNGPLCSILSHTWKSGNGSLIEQHMHLYHRLPRIDFRTSVRWVERQVFLKAAFPLNMNPHVATFEIPFGTIQRPARPKTPQDKAKFEVPAQQWADFSDQKLGVSLLNDSKYGYDARDGVLRLSLIRSPHYPHDTEPHKRTGDGFTDQGRHEFSYALLPHAGDWRQGETIRRAREFNQPLLLLEGATLMSFPSFLTGIAPNIFVDAVKKAEDGKEIIVRLHEGHGQSCKATLQFGYTIDQAFECDLMETVVKKLSSSRSKLPLKFSPYEIKTLKLRLRPSLART